MERERTHRAHGRPASEVSHLTGAPAPSVSALSNLQTHSSHNCQRPANHFNAVMGKKVSSKESEQPLKQLVPPHNLRVNGVFEKFLILLCFGELALSFIARTEAGISGPSTRLRVAGSEHSAQPCTEGKLPPNTHGPFLHLLFLHLRGT